jgi:hypothetical protein
MRSPSGARLAACFAVGAVAGTLLDGIHAYGDVLSYEDTAFGRWAWFVPLEFGLLGLAVGLAMPLLERLAHGEEARWGIAAVLAETVAFALLYGATALVGDDAAGLLAAALLGLAAARLAIGGRFSSPGDWLYVVLAAILGPAGEALLVALGVFEYHAPDFAGIPVWLPGLWANGGFFVRRVLKTIVGEEAGVSPAPRHRVRIAGDRS